MGPKSGKDGGKKSYLSWDSANGGGEGGSSPKKDEKRSRPGQKKKREEGVQETLKIRAAHSTASPSPACTSESGEAARGKEKGSSHASGNNVVVLSLTPESTIGRGPRPQSMSTTLFHVGRKKKKAAGEAISGGGAVLKRKKDCSHSMCSSSH